MWSSSIQIIVVMYFYWCSYSEVVQVVIVNKSVGNNHGKYQENNEIIKTPRSTRKWGQQDHKVNKIIDSPDLSKTLSQWRQFSQTKLFPKVKGKIVVYIRLPMFYSAGDYQFRKWNVQQKTDMLR